MLSRQAAGGTPTLPVAPRPNRTGRIIAKKQFKTLNCCK